MNVKLKKNFTFYTGLVYENRHEINVYDVTVYMTTNSMDPESHNIVYDRMTYWIDEVLHGSVLIGQDSEKLDAYKATGQRVLVFPQDPVDQLVGVMLYLKLTAMVENHMLITAVHLSSAVGDDVIYIHQAEDASGPMAVDGWWQDPRPAWAHGKKSRAAGKVIAMDRMPEWSDLDLAWEKQTEQENSTVVFADFPKK